MTPLPLFLKSTTAMGYQESESVDVLPASLDELKGEFEGFSQAEKAEAAKVLREVADWLDEATS